MGSVNCNLGNYDDPIAGGKYVFDLIAVADDRVEAIFENLQIGDFLHFV